MLWSVLAATPPVALSLSRLMAGEQHTSYRLAVRASPVHTLLLQVRLQPFFDYLSER